MNKTIQLSNSKIIPFTSYDIRLPNEIRNLIPDKKTPTFLGSPSEGIIYHQGYLAYLAKAWANHYSVVMRPNDIWYIIINELSAAIKDNPDKYASLFTTTPGTKQEIIVITDNVETINPELVISKLHDLVPSDINSFFPEFSTSTMLYNLAINVSFCDLVSPYYSYATMLCDIPAIKIEGTEDDWNNIIINLSKLTQLFVNDIQKYLLRCFVMVQSIIKAVKNDDVDFFKKMVKLTQCGSGHQFDMNGWIIEFLNREDLTESIQLEELPSHFSHMDYKNLNTGREFSLYCGLFYSKVQEQFLIPEYDAFSFEKIKTDTQSDNSIDTTNFLLYSMPVHSKETKIKKWTIIN